MIIHNVLDIWKLYPNSVAFLGQIPWTITAGKQIEKALDSGEIVANQGDELICVGYDSHGERRGFRATVAEVKTQPSHTVKL